MFYALVDVLMGAWSPFNVFRYITFRSAYATITALLICFLFGGWTIRKLRKLQIGETIREEGPKHHQVKAGTPTMGGLLILVAVVIPMLLWGNLSNPMVLVALLGTVYMGFLGWLDDYLKLSRKKKTGLRGRWKLLAQGMFGLMLGWWMINQPEYAGIATRTTVPFLKGVYFDLGPMYIPFAVLVFAGTGNAVNLADGLDGLAVGLAAICFIALAAFSYATGNAIFANYLNILHLRSAGS